MPKAAIDRDDIVDYVLPIDKIADVLSTLVMPDGQLEPFEPEPV
jgi:hypothetical protein